MRNETNSQAFRAGFHDGIPIGLGYFAVAFALGVAARDAGMTPFQGFLASILCNASAGEYAGFTVIAARSGYLGMALITLVANARYLLMSTAMSQRLDPEMKKIHRFGMAMYITDEIFAIEIARPGYLHPFYTYGAAAIASPMWAAGTALGILAGNLLVLILVCFAASWISEKLPLVGTLSQGNRVILLTVILSAAAALLFPHPAEEDKDN